MQTGIMGGTFNPPHKGHINAALAAKEALSLDRIIFIPAGIPPHKKLAEDSANSEERLQMTRLVAESVGATVSDIEIRREGKSYTVDTLRELKRSMSDDTLWLIMGTDMFLSIETWREPEEIFRLAHLAVIPRADGDVRELIRHGEMLRDKYGANVKVVDAQAVTISSTELRAEFAKGIKPELLTDSVYRYIMNKKLYGVCGSDEI